MIVYGVCVGPTGKFESIARPAIERLLRDGDQVITTQHPSSICAAYNEILERVDRQPDLEALVLVHDDVELRDAELPEKLISMFQDDTVGVVGVVGATGVRSLHWWEYETWGAVSEDRLGHVQFSRGAQDVEVVDGLFLALSPSCVSLRFDDATFRDFHGYDADFCFTVRANGRRVLVSEIELLHRTQGGYGDKSAFRAADRAFQSKWGVRDPRRWRRRIRDAVPLLNLR